MERLSPFGVIRCIDEEWEFGDYPTVSDVAEICGVTPEFVTAIHAQYSRQGRLHTDSVLIVVRLFVSPS